jgi:hypothetical protein
MYISTMHAMNMKFILGIYSEKCTEMNPEMFFKV